CSFTVCTSPLHVLVCIPGGGVAPGCRPRVPEVDHILPDFLDLSNSSYALFGFVERTHHLHAWFEESCLHLIPPPPLSNVGHHVEGLAIRHIDAWTDIRV